MDSAIVTRFMKNLALDDRARAACVARAWRDAEADPCLWRVLDFDGTEPGKVTADVVARLCSRAGGLLRELKLCDVTGLIAMNHVLDALINGKCTGIRYVERGTPHDGDLSVEWFPAWMTGEIVQRAKGFCPLVEWAVPVAYITHSDDVEAIEAIAALTGPRELFIDRFDEDEDLPSLVVKTVLSALRKNHALRCLNVAYGSSLGDADAVMIASWLKTNTTVAELILADEISDVGARALAEALRVNTTLKEIYFTGPPIGEVGEATRKAFEDVLLVNPSLKLCWSPT
jgi:hypothetical protein